MPVVVQILGRKLYSLEFVVSDYFAESSGLTQSPLPLILALTTGSGQKNSTSDALTPL